jgi:hypothetical protein
MAYHKVPRNWTETDCNDAIEKTLTEALRRLGKEKHEQSAQCFVEIARIVRSIPEVRRRVVLQEHLERKKQKALKAAGIMREEVAKEVIEDQKQREKMEDFKKAKEKVAG